LVARHAVRTLPLAIALAVVSIALPQVAFAAENRPAPPTMSSPTATSSSSSAGNLEASGTAIPGGEVYVSIFASPAAFAAARTRDEKEYQQFKAGNFSGFGGPGAVVGSDGLWTWVISSADIQEVATGDAGSRSAKNRVGKAASTWATIWRA